MSNVGIVDYGLCNLDSVYRAVEECSGKPFIVDNPKDFSDFDHIIIPGVGSFSDAMKNLEKQGLIDLICEEAIVNKTPILGICLGMQLLASLGTEIEEKKGLNLIEGVILRLEPAKTNERIPHIGWNEVNFKNPSELLLGIDSGSDFYFVHSYYFDCHEEYKIATTPYANNFPSVVGKDNVFGVQFHPEKSQQLGFKILKNFLSI